MQTILKSCLVMVFPSVVLAFVSQQQSFAPRISSDIAMAPRFDKAENRWFPTNDEEGPDGGYDIWGSLLRQGPSPFLTRIFKADEYEQAVLKFMAVDKMNRPEAQANMDAYLRNPSDWTYNRVKGYNVDYLTLDSKQIVLTLVWSTLVLALVGRGIYCLESGDNFWAILGLGSKVAECVKSNTCIIDLF